jgi:hypothetical protein
LGANAAGATKRAAADVTTLSTLSEEVSGADVARA